MANLTANFLVNPIFLVVQFIDSSTPGNTGSITGWAWNFGDPSSGGSNTSTLQSPSHTFTAPGTYIVKLTVTDSNAATAQYTRNIIVNTIPVLPVTIKDFVKIKIPASVQIPAGAIDAYVAQYQLFMQPLVNSPGVLEADTYNEMAYPPLVNALIAMAAAYSITLDYANSGLAIASGSGAGGTPGVVKKVKTGPAEAEFQDVSSSSKNFFGTGGLIAVLRNELCTLARRVMINMPMCPPLPSPILQQQKAGRTSNGFPAQFINIWECYPNNITILI